MGERLKRALIVLAKCWGIALVCVLIPIAHFILVPGFLIAGFVMFFVVLNAEFLFKKAGEHEAEKIAALVNSAYRGDSSRKGWTTEADLVGGLRIDREGVLKHMSEPGAWFEVAYDNKNEMVASVFLKEEPEGVLYLGMFAVNPDLQGQSIGKKFLEHVEQLVLKKKLKAIRITVIHLREELIAYYERRGFVKTGKSEPFLYNDPREGIALRNDLKLIELKKTV